MRRTTRLNPHSALTVFSLAFYKVCEREEHDPSLSYLESYSKYGRNRLPLWGFKCVATGKSVMVDPIGDLIFRTADGKERTEALFSLEALGEMYKWAHDPNQYNQDEAMYTKARAVVFWLQSAALSED